MRLGKAPMHGRDNGGVLEAFEAGTGVGDGVAEWMDGWLDVRVMRRVSA